MSVGSNKRWFVYGFIVMILFSVCLSWSQEDELTSPPEEIIPFQLAGFDEELPSVYKVESDELLDYDPEKGIVYGKARTRIHYGKYYVEADRIILDDRAKEVQASGDVLLRTPVDEVTADFVRYNFARNEGYAQGVRGRHRYLFYQSPKKEERPAFMRLSEEEALVQKGSITTCDFPLPHYRIRSREILIFTNERVFIRGALLYLHEVPIFYFPVYTRSLREHSPWSFEIGKTTRLGYYVRVGYDYWHELEEPSLTRDDEFESRSSGHASAHVDYFSERGIGYGMEYRYNFEFRRHRGYMNLYNIDDDSRWLEGEELSEQRWIINLLHRSEIMQDLYLILNIDEFSDPEVYWEFMDPFADIERGRAPQRRARASLSLRRDDFVGHILVEIKDRISRDRITNFSDPTDDDLDFDEDPFDLYDEDENEGLSPKRFGRVTERYPQIIFSTRKLNIEDLPLYYNVDVNIINNLDRGLNLIDERDDAFVRGIDIYQQITHILRFSPRYTLLSKFGAGIAYFNRQDYDYDYDFPPGTVFPTIIDNMPFDDEETFLMGTRPVRLRDADKFYAYADADIRFNARFTDYLTAYLRYKIREGTNDSLGEYYESIGDRHAKADIYNFRTKEHFIEARMDYLLSRPKINLFLLAWQNLQSDNDIYANERLTRISVGGNYKNRLQTFDWTSSISYERRQILDPTHPDAFEQGTVYGVSVISYIPKHERWWTRLSGSVYHVLDEGSLNRTRGVGWWFSEYGRRDEDTSFSEQDTQYTLSYLLGGKIGPKYILEGNVDYDSQYASGIRGFNLVLKRDLHDFIALVEIGASRSIFEYDEEDEERGEDWEWDFKFALELNAPLDRKPVGVSSINTLVDSNKSIRAEDSL